MDKLPIETKLVNTLQTRQNLSRIYADILNEKLSSIASRSTILDIISSHCKDNRQVHLNKIVDMDEQKINEDDDEDKVNTIQQQIRRKVLSENSILQKQIQDSQKNCKDIKQKIDKLKMINSQLALQYSAIQQKLISLKLQSTQKLQKQPTKNPNFQNQTQIKAHHQNFINHLKSRLSHNQATIQNLKTRIQQKIEHKQYLLHLKSTKNSLNAQFQQTQSEIRQIDQHIKMHKKDIKEYLVAFQNDVQAELVQQMRREVQERQPIRKNLDAAYQELFDIVDTELTIQENTDIMRLLAGQN